ncbi:Rha family transcriptional regulator [Capnocytophaga granulosa]|uniref:Rha family transcriptional regulator n=1 Tax=Capnocytophaga granulosa TaxID=45242 RepID=UPI0023F0E84A|nr:Rha family transcriptional regulator [Capnocytophaga granulosa]
MKELINTIEQTMSSFEIAKLTGKRHDHVIRDIRELNKGYEKLYLPKIGLKHRISDLGFGRQRNDPYFELTKMQTFDLLTGYNTELRIKVNRRWAELEAQTLIRMPKSILLKGLEFLPYIEWLYFNAYSLNSSSFYRRIRKYPQHFFKASNNKWYINKAFAEQLLEFRSTYHKLKEVKGLPQVHQMTIFEIIAEVEAEQEKLKTIAK